LNKRPGRDLDLDAIASEPDFASEQIRHNLTRQTENIGDPERPCCFRV
jgi:hypothetical protein